MTLSFPIVAVLRGGQLIAKILFPGLLVLLLARLALFVWPE
jgi:hypothetical protein